MRQAEADPKALTDEQALALFTAEGEDLESPARGWPTSSAATWSATT